jgi:hypothetical protein
MLLALLLFAAPTPEEDERWLQLKDRIELAPQDVSTFIERRQDCLYIGGEVGTGYAERESMLQAERKKLRCDDVEADEIALRNKYRDPQVSKLLDDTAHLLPW